ncbi:MAG: cysteine desulfurase [Clostridia bacterium]|nr:cysteine desulfurase [Clostridia bacterium]
MIYFDNAATTRPYTQAIDAADRIMRDVFANPSAIHSFGMEAGAEMKAARAAISRILGAKPEELYFTGGGTEGNNIALFGTADAKRRMGERIVISSVEHASVENPAKELKARGFDVISVPAPRGQVDHDALFRAIDDKTILVSVMLVNNELGTINDIAQIRKLMDEKCPRATLHCDAVQGFLKIDFSVKSILADIITISAHKIHAPKGAGALYIKRGTKINPIILGGGQEAGMRSGTENLPAIVAFAEAAKKGYAEFSARESRARKIKERIVSELFRYPEYFKINSPENSSPFILNVSTPVMSETMLHYLECFGIYISVGSACSSKHKSKSILSRAGFDEKTYKTGVRISIGDNNTEEEAVILAARMTEGARTLIHA